MTEPTILPPPSGWQLIANAAMALVAALGGILFRNLSNRMRVLEDAHKKLVTQEHFDDTIDGITEERRWMHRENSERFDNLTERLDRVLER